MYADRPPPILERPIRANIRVRRPIETWRIFSPSNGVVVEDRVTWAYIRSDLGGKQPDLYATGHKNPARNRGNFLKRRKDLQRSVE